MSTTPNWIALEETLTGFKWLDGKDIYRKAIYFGEPPSNNERSYPHLIENLEDIVLMSGIIKNKLSNAWLPTENNITLSVNSSVINAYSVGKSWVGWRLIVVLEYTKATSS